MRELGIWGGIREWVTAGILVLTELAYAAHNQGQLGPRDDEDLRKGAGYGKEKTDAGKLLEMTGSENI